MRRFTALDVPQAILMVKKSLGDDAIILKTRKVRKGGLLSFLAREMVEVTAASPDRNPASPTPPTDRAGDARRQLQAHPAIESVRELRDEIGDLKGQIRELTDQVKFDRMPSLPPHVARRYMDMVQAGMDERTAKELTQEVNLRFMGEQLEDKTLVDRELSGMIAARIPIRRLPATAGSRARVVALIGPTGVGKTTTMAKLVTSYRFWGRTPTTLVSADTYRVAALEQLKTFAAIAGLPMEAVYQPAAMKNVLARHQDKSAIFIDTAGRSQADTAKLEELASFLDAAAPDDVLLCLALATRLEDQLDVVERYRRLNPTGIIFTKLDESRGLGIIPAVLRAASLPATYFTCGQNVPDDILGANPRLLAELILKPELLVKEQKSRFEGWMERDKNADQRESRLA